MVEGETIANAWWLADESKVVLPEGCRMLDYYMLNWISDLKAQQTKDLKFKKSTHDILKRHDEIMRITESQIQQLHLDIARLDKVYYHIFPERLAGDIKLEKQLYNLTAKHPLDGGETKE